MSVKMRLSLVVKLKALRAAGPPRAVATRRPFRVPPDSEALPD